MDRISPIYHPTAAKDYINVTNNLNPDDTYAWYDSENPDNIVFPSVFTYKKTDMWDDAINLKLSKVVLNTSSGDISSVSPSLPSSQGTFNATLQKEDDNLPTMDLYFQGNIPIKEEYVNDDGVYTHTIYVTNMSTKTFDTSKSDTGMNKNINIEYYIDYSFYEGYEYEVLRNTITVNWAKKGNNFVSVFTNNARGTITLNLNPSSVSTYLDVLPIITFKSELQSKESHDTPIPDRKWYKYTKTAFNSFYIWQDTGQTYEDYPILDNSYSPTDGIDYIIAYHNGTDTEEEEWITAYNRGYDGYLYGPSNFYLIKGSNGNGKYISTGLEYRIGYYD